ncbi:MAG: TadE/TadG family type IV pilus assembly protein [Candidatus Dormibacteria bacterium]
MARVARTTCRRQEGQGTVEFVLVAPMFFVLVFMIIQSALYVNAIATIDNATREAARVASLCGGSKAAQVTYQTGVYTASTYANTATACEAAVDGTVTANLGLLKFIAGVNPAVTVCVAPVSGSCSASYGPNTRPQQGQVVQVDVAYSYSYYFGAFLGVASPFKTIVSSSARAVAQQ